MQMDKENEVFNRDATDYEECVNAETSILGNSHEDFNIYKMQYLKPYLDVDHSIKLLDYGCGIGLLSRTIQRNFKNVILHGFDISTEEIKNLVPELQRPGNRFTSNLDEIDDDYDVILLATVLHHVPPETRDEVINICYEHLSYKGILIVFEHNVINPMTKNLVLHSGSDRLEFMLSMHEVENRISRAGFHAVCGKYIVFFLKQLGLLRHFEGLISKLPLGAQYMVIGKK